MLSNNIIEYNASLSEICFVWTPLDAYEHRVSIKKSNHFIYRVGETKAEGVNLPEGEWELLGEAFELTEKQWRRVFLGEACLYDKGQAFCLENNNKTEYFEQAQHAGLALTKQLGVYKDNPQGKSAPSSAYFAIPIYLKIDWAKAEERRGSWQVLIKTSEQKQVGDEAFDILLIEQPKSNLDYVDIQHIENQGDHFAMQLTDAATISDVNYYHITREEAIKMAKWILSRPDIQAQ